MKSQSRKLSLREDSGVNLLQNQTILVAFRNQIYPQVDNTTKVELMLSSRTLFQIQQAIETHRGKDSDLNK